MHFIKLTSVYDGNPVFVNATNITTIEPYTYQDGMYTVITMVGGAQVKVSETADVVVESIVVVDSIRRERLEKED